MALPYLTLPSIHIVGPFDLPLVGWTVPSIDLQPFGILVAAGVLFGAWIVRKRAEYLLLDEEHVRSMVGWVAVCGFLGAHFFDALFYQWDKLASDPLLLLRLWDGISSYGGFLGALLGFFAFCRVKQIDRMAYADAVVWGGLPGFTFGRMGCTLVHDHPGRETDFALAIDYPASRGSLEGARHDLGLYELMFLLVLIFALFVVVRGWRRRTGFAIGFIWTSYGVVRFFLDYLRLNEHDPRYFGLTFAQYVSVFSVLFGLTMLKMVYRPRPAVEEAALPEANATGGSSAGNKTAANRKKRQDKKKRKKK